MDTDARGQLGGMDASESVRKRLAGQSRGWKCPMCGKSNEGIMGVQEEAVREKGGEGRKEEVPEELRLAYREDLGEANGKVEEKKQIEPDGNVPEQQATQHTMSAQMGQAVTARQPASAPQTQPARTPQQTQQQQQVRRDEGIPPWIDKAIYGILAVLAYLLLKKIG